MIILQCTVFCIVYRYTEEKTPIADLTKNEASSSDFFVKRKRIKNHYKWMEFKKKKNPSKWQQDS